MNSLDFALLGLLARGELSGYDLAGKLKRPLGFFWPARHSQIYPALAKLSAGGLVRERVVVQKARPNKKIYALTPAGRSALRAWITEPPERVPSRDELLLKTYSLWLAEPGPALALLQAAAKRHEVQLAEYEGFRRQMEQFSKKHLQDPRAPDFATYATLRRGIGFEREYLAWCRWIIGVLEKPVPRAQPRASRRT